MSAISQLYDDPSIAVTGNVLKDRRVSICKQCRLGVFPHQPWVFTRTPHLGICHQSCVDEGVR